MTTHIRAANIRTGVDQPLHVGPVCAAQIESEGLGKRQIRAIAALLVPALDSSADGAGYYCHVERLRYSPFVVYLGLNGITLFLSELILSGNILVVVGVLSDQRTLLQQFSILDETLLISKVLHLGHEFVFGNSGKRVLDFRLEVGR